MNLILSELFGPLFSKELQDKNILFSMRDLNSSDYVNIFSNQHFFFKEDSVLGWAGEEYSEKNDAGKLLKVL